MAQQISCPQCSSPVTANIIQVIDVDQHPQLKQMIIQGALNTAQCQNCGWSGQVASPLVYHDSAHDLLINFVPMELNIPYAEQEQLMGQMVRAVVDGIPQEKRRSYLLQPQQIMRWQTFIETVLETEGITKEMIARQREQSELIQKLMAADMDVVEYLFNENKALLDDEAVISMIQNGVQQLSQAPGQTETLIRLSNLQAFLMTNTEAGKRMEERQLALHALQMEAKAAGGVTPQSLASHVVKNMDNDGVIDALIQAVGGLNYEFFSALTAQIDDAAKSGESAAVTRLTEVRTRLLKIYDAMREESAKMMQDARDTINRIVASPDKRQALQENGDKVDEMFVQLLDQELEQARAKGDLERSMALVEIKKIISELIDQANPPHMRLLTDMVRASSPVEMTQMLDAAGDLVNPELMAALDQLMVELPEEIPDDLKMRLAEIRGLIGARLAQ